MTNSGNEDNKKLCVCEGERGEVGVGDVGVGVSCSLHNFYARGNQTFISSAREGSNTRLEILQLSGGECTVPSPVAGSYYHPETSI